MNATPLSPELQSALEEQQALLARTLREESRLVRESLDLFAAYVDPAEAYRHDGQWWAPSGGTGGAGGLEPAGLTSEAELTQARNQCRALALSNEFAINGHENRISYIVGPGHRYRAAVRSDAPAPAADDLRQAQQVLDEFMHDNRWQQRQQEIVRRRDRDGEAFLRFFLDARGRTRVRFVEPWQVTTPADLQRAEYVRCGVEAAPGDVEDVRGYWLDDGEFVPAADMQHRKANVDANVPRGVPLFYPVRQNLARAEKLLRNMAAVSDIQTAVALIRKHHSGTRTALEQLRSNLAAAAPGSPGGPTSHFQQFRPGTILDVHADVEYDFPAKGLDASRYVLVLQAILRAVASRLCMPEFMLTSDASNANYSSTMVAEGPAVKMFERLQHDMREDDRQVMLRAIGDAVRTGRLPESTLLWLEIETTLPTLAVRDRMQEAQIDRLLCQQGVLSRPTLAERHGLDYAAERRRMNDEVGPA